MMTHSSIERYGMYILWNLKLKHILSDTLDAPGQISFEIGKYHISVHVSEYRFPWWYQEHNFHWFPSVRKGRLSGQMPGNRPLFFGWRTKSNQFEKGFWRNNMYEFLTKWVFVLDENGIISIGAQCGVISSGVWLRSVAAPNAFIRSWHIAPSASQPHSALSCLRPTGKTFKH